MFGPIRRHSFKIVVTALWHSLWTTTWTQPWLKQWLWYLAVVYSTLGATKSSSSGPTPQNTIQDRSSAYTFWWMQLKLQWYWIQSRVLLFFIYLFFIFTNLSFRSCQSPVGWKSYLCLWKETAACISSLQWWAQVRIGTIGSGILVTYLCGRLTWCPSHCVRRSVTVLFCSDCTLWLLFPDSRFQWSIPEPEQEFIFVKPNHGELHPNDSSVRNKSNNKCTREPFDSIAYHLYRSRCGHSAHWKRKNTHLHPNSPFGPHRLRDVMTQNSPLKWREWAPKVL